MTIFIGRHDELAVLEKAYHDPASAFLPVYGRRRVGKSELILHFLQSKPGIYFLGKKAPAALQVREFLTEAAAVIDEPLLASLAIEDWGQALDAVVDRFRGEGKLILALDEFQWIAGSSPELPSLLQERWDRRWQRSGKVMLILCGSYVGFMEREVLGRKSPLFGRRTGQILLRPFSYLEATQFHPAYSIVDRARAYFICGGVPYYLRFFSDQRSLEMNLAAEVLTEHAALFREPDFLLREELREVENYYAVLLAIAHGKTTNQAIASETSIAPQSLHYYLQQLIELGYLVRRYPLAERSRITRHVHYDLGDPLLRFWFRFVFPNTSYLLHMGAERGLRDRIEPHLEAYFGHCFERLCREALPNLYRREGVIAAFEIGEFWGKNVQIDVVGLRDDGWTDLGECRWGTVGSRAALTREIEERARAFPNPRQATIARRIFTREKPPRAVAEGVRWHGLEDLYAPVE